MKKYKLSNWDHSEDQNGFIVVDDEGKSPLKIYDIDKQDVALNRQNAENIVKAINSHYRLIYALEKLVSLCEKQLVIIDGEFGNCRDIEELKHSLKDLPSELILAYYVLNGEQK